MSNRAGFTLIELMVAAVISTIVIMGCGGLLVGMFRVQSRSQSYMAMQLEGDMIKSYLREQIQNKLPNEIVIVGPHWVDIYDNGVLVSSVFSAPGSGGLMKLIRRSAVNDVVMTDHLSKYDLDYTGKKIFVCALQLHDPAYNQTVDRDISVCPSGSQGGTGGAGGSDPTRGGQYSAFKVRVQEDLLNMYEGSILNEEVTYEE